MSRRRPKMLRRVAIPTLLLLSTAGMVFCARVPAEGPAWRTGFVVAALLGFVALAAAWRWSGFSKRELLGLALLLRLLAFPLLPVLSDDGFRYVWDGLVQVEAGVNPYRFTPDDPALRSLQEEDVYSRLNSPQYYSVYPPVSQFVFALGAVGYRWGWEVSWYLIKLCFLVAEVGGLWLLSRMVSARALVLYAWNPLVVMEIAGQAHTEALAVPLLILAVWTSEKGRGGRSAVAIAVAGWVKLLPFLLLPFAARRHGPRVLFPALFATALLLLPYAAPYVPTNVGASLSLYTQSFEFNAGPYYALKEIGSTAMGLDVSKQMGPALQGMFFLVLICIYTYSFHREYSVRLWFSITLALFFACATTVHPWYLLPLLALLPLLTARPTGRLFSAAWLWLSACSMATYWRYAGPVGGYAAVVFVGWLGWGVLMLAAGASMGLPTLMRARAESKWRWISAHLPRNATLDRVLDLGAGDGYVGERVQVQTEAAVALADVVDFNQTALPFFLYNGRSLPFPDKTFDLTLLNFVLHHAADPGAVLEEARRVTKGYVVVVESVEETPLQRRLFEPLDKLANRIRSAGAMGAQDDQLHLRTGEAWEELFRDLRFEVVTATRKGRGLHRQRLYVLAPLLQ